MNLFFCNDIKDELAILNEEESYHAFRVLRMKAGDEISFVDGKGTFYKGELINADSKKCSVKILERKTEYGKRNYYLHIAIAPTKNIERLEWFLEKTTEIGIDEITPIICQHSERRVVKNERLNRVILSAMKQSLKAYLPKLNPAIEFHEFINDSSLFFSLSLNEVGGKVFICKQSDEKQSLLKNNYNKADKALLLIGPEGDFSEEEMALTKSKNIVAVSLGESRLRTETAGVVVATVINTVNQ